jgi:cell division protein FtsB
LAKQREMNEEKLSERAKEINLALENEIKLKFLESQNATIKNILNVQKKKIKELESKLVTERNSIKIIEKTKEFESLVDTKNSIIKNYRRSKIQFDITLTKLRSKIVLLKKQNFQKDSLLNKKKLLYKKKLAKLIGENDLKAIGLLSDHQNDLSKFEMSLEDLSNENNNLKSKNVELEKKCNTILSQDRQFAELKIENKKLKSENVDLKEKLKTECCNLTYSIKTQDHQITELKNENTHLKSQNTQLEENLNSIISQARQIAFMTLHSDSLVGNTRVNKFGSIIPEFDFLTETTDCSNKNSNEFVREMVNRFFTSNMLLPEKPKE